MGGNDAVFYQPSRGKGRGRHAKEFPLRGVNFFRKKAKRPNRNIFSGGGFFPHKEENKGGGLPPHNRPELVGGRGKERRERRSRARISYHVEKGKKSRWEKKREKV